MKKNQKSTSKMPVLRGKSMAQSPGVSGKALPGGGKSMVNTLPRIMGKATGSL